MLAHAIENFTSMSEEPKRPRWLMKHLSLRKILKKFGKKGCNAAHKELHQIHKRSVRNPMGVDILTPDGRNKAIEILILFNEKRREVQKAEPILMGVHKAPVRPKINLIDPNIC